MNMQQGRNNKVHAFLPILFTSIVSSIRNLSFANSTINNFSKTRIGQQLDQCMRSNLLWSISDPWNSEGAIPSPSPPLLFLVTSVWNDPFSQQSARWTTWRPPFNSPRESFLHGNLRPHALTVSPPQYYNHPYFQSWSTVSFWRPSQLLYRERGYRYYPDSLSRWSLISD